ncbi:ATP-binding cassette sub-family D member 3-like [Acropora millepora]|uniref:ATP-binding cassette sub-family D member 3-like n=1 Tax=Acropora millepora TaxID=45264 RepID=UPI0010FCB063|nr:ATP-binding cassette sub-family D member 3-like [Acropora millepora]
MVGILSKIAPSYQWFNNTKTSGIVVAAVGTGILILWRKKLNDLKRKRKDDPDDLHISLAEEKAAKKEKAAVDALFFSKLMRILKIIIPGFWTPEAGYLTLVALSLIARTYCDVWMINNSTATERSIISGDHADFRKNLTEFVFALPFISVINQLMKLGLNELKLRFRARLTRHLYGQYLNSFTFYRMSNLDNRIANADQLLTQDVDKFCNSLAELYSNVSKPLLDIAIYIQKLTGAIGIQGPALMLGYMAVSGLLLTRLRRPVGKMTAEEQHHEGEFRYVNSRLITNSEEIAFYQGGKRERLTMEHTFQRLVNHIRGFIQFKFIMGIIDNVIAKYLATLVGFYVVSRPFLDKNSTRHASSTHSQKMEDYYKSGRMLVKMAEAIGRLVLAGRELATLAGYTSRVSQLMNVLKDLNKGKYQRTMVSTSDSFKEGDSKSDRISADCLDPSKGQIIQVDHLIRFENVPLVTPNGDVLIKELSFEVRSGMNVLVCGPNGCGKSSLFRILGELWPLFGGKLVKPNKSKLFYIPQRPYMTLGTLRDQVIYPDTKEDMHRKGFSDQDLEEYLKQVHLENILEREGSWDVIQDWMDVLSGGEKQRIAMARLFYHRPQFAILDECTSAVSVDVEGFMYTRCREVGITLFTVSHRKSLWKYHEYVLYMDGRGAYEYKPIDSAMTEFGS